MVGYGVMHPFGFIFGFVMMCGVNFSDPSKQYTYLANPVAYRNILHLITIMPCYVIGYIAVHTFGIKLVYPGSIGLLQLFLGKLLL